MQVTCKRIMYICFIIFAFINKVDAYNNLFCNVSVIDGWWVLKPYISAVNGHEVKECDGTVLGTSGVTCYKFNNGGKIYLKNKFYIPGEKFDSVVVSSLLKYISNKIEISSFSPKIRFVTNDKNEIIGAVSAELSDFKSIADFISIARISLV